MLKIEVIKSLVVASGIFALAALVCIVLHSFDVNIWVVIVVPSIVLVAGIVVVALLLAMDNRHTHNGDSQPARLIFAGSDPAAFKVYNKEDAPEIFANANIKWFIKR